MPKSEEECKVVITIYDAEGNVVLEEEAEAYMASQDELDDMLALINLGHEAIDAMRIVKFGSASTH